MFPFVVAEGVTVSSFSSVIGELLEVGAQIITWGLSTFPVNLAIVAGIGGLAVGFVRKAKKVAH